MKNIIFIIGVGRSGTTLIQSMLHAHSEIEFSPETHFIKRYILPEVNRGKYSWDSANMLIETLQKDELLNGLNKNVEETVKKSLLERSNKYLTGSVFYNLLDFEKVIYIGDKDPMNTNYLSIIKKVFPDAYILHIIRDPRDVVSSRLRSNWGKNNSALWHSSEYKFSISKARNEGQAYFGDNYLEIQYEKLLTTTEFELRRICKFLKLNFEKNMLHHQAEAKSLLRNDELEWKSNVLKPVDKSKIGKWKENLSKKQIVIIESILFDFLDEFNYEQSLPIPLYKKVFYNISSWIIGRMFKLKFG